MSDLKKNISHAKPKTKPHKALNAFSGGGGIPLSQIPKKCMALFGGSF